MSDPSPPYLIKRSFTDFDELSSEAKRWDLDLRQLDSGSFRGELTQFGTQNVHVSNARFGKTLQQRGAPPVGHRTVVIPGHRDVFFEWRGRQIDGNSLMIFPRGAELAAVSNSTFDVFTCSFPEDLLTQVAEANRINHLDSLRKESEVVRCDSRHMAKVRNFLRMLSARLVNDENLLNDLRFGESLTSEVPALILRAVASPDHNLETRSNVKKRRHALEATENFIEERIADPPTVLDICEAVQVSVRTLQNAFSERYGISPKQYVQAIRLNLVRKALIFADSRKQKVSDVANRYAFWHMGQFAADYRRQFGELPSETLVTCYPKN